MRIMLTEELRRAGEAGRQTGGERIGTREDGTGQTRSPFRLFLVPLGEEDRVCAFAYQRLIKIESLRRCTIGTQADIPGRIRTDETGVGARVDAETETRDREMACEARLAFWS